MEPHTEPDLPVPLPRPLSDPLRRYRWFILLFVLPAIAIYLLLPDVSKVRVAALRASGVKIIEPKRTLRDTAAAAIAAASFALLVCTFRILPRRASNAFYLRSFRNDAETTALRIAAQAALGRAFRLSGIRDPRRRWPALIRHILDILFLIRYAQPQFMNLEAGRDWKRRLWRSLGSARCALIDVTELTPFVLEEIELATRCLGFHRVLFIGDSSRTADEWRRAILTALGSPDVPPECLRIALWADNAQGRAFFRDQVRTFADRLPADPPGLNSAAYPETPSTADPGGDAVTGENWRTFLLAILIGAAINGSLIWANNLLPAASLIWFLPAVIYNTLAFLLLLQYLALCGSLREQLRIGATFLFAAVLAGLPVGFDLVALFQGSRNAARRAEFRNNLKQEEEGASPAHAPEAARGGPTNNLKQLTLALHDFDQNSQGFPTANTLAVNGNLTDGHVFTTILPYSEQGSLYGQLNATDNGRQNPFASTQIRLYLCPSDSPAPAQQTPSWSSYAVSVGSNGPWGSLPAGGDYGMIVPNHFYGAGSYCGVGIAAITDGTSNGFVVGEMGFELQNAWFADGSVHFLTDGLSPATHQALSPRDGGEVISDSCY